MGLGMPQQTYLDQWLKTATGVNVEYSESLLFNRVKFKCIICKSSLTIDAEAFVNKWGSVIPYDLQEYVKIHSHVGNHQSSASKAPSWFPPAVYEDTQQVMGSAKAAKEADYLKEYVKEYEAKKKALLGLDQNVAAMKAAQLQQQSSNVNVYVKDNAPLKMKPGDMVVGANGKIISVVEPDGTLRSLTGEPKTKAKVVVHTGRRFR